MMWNRYLVCLLLFVAGTLSVQAQSASDSLVNYYKNKAQKYLIKEKEADVYYQISDKGITLYNGIGNSRKTEFYLSWNQIDSCRKLVKDYDRFKSYYSSWSKEKKYYASVWDSLVMDTLSPVKGLQGKRIAIDPGHISFGIEQGRLEGKCLEFKADSARGLYNEVQIVEGRLTLATALLLKEKLEKEGAIVYLTRTKGDTAANGLVFEDWLKSDSSGYKGKTLSFVQKKMAFMKKYNNLDLVYRVKAINSFKPDLTIIIHFNVDEKNKEWTQPSDKNFNMVFVPGALRTEEMSGPKGRMEFLRLLVSTDLENSFNAGKAITESYTEVLKVPLAKPQDAEYIGDKCLFTNYSGVYCRNLALTRLVHSPLVYGETLYQDDVKECVRLSTIAGYINGIPYSVRLQEVAEAYFKGILVYFQ